MIALVLAPGCALAHEVSVDANVDVGGSPGVLLPCMGGGGNSGLGRDCGWTLGGTVSCRPGALVQIACGNQCGLGSCSGDAMLRVCDSVPCTGARSLAQNDDGCGGLCPDVGRFPCPASGQLAVLTAPFSAGSAYSCSFVSR